MNTDLILRLALALAIGLLTGVERGWRERDAPAGSRTAGIRTFGLSGLLGGLLAALAMSLGSGSVFAAGFLGFAAVFGWFKWHEAEHSGTFSVTGVVAALVVFGLGGLAVSGDYRVAAAGGVALAGVLASRDALHGLLRRLTWAELRSALLLAGMTAIVLPLMPNRAIDPWGGVNPWEIWFFTVLTAGISFAGYVAVRWLGPGKGVLVSGLAGALVSSTAVTIAFARRARVTESVRPLAAGACLAAMISALRVVTIVSVVKPEVGMAMAAPALTAALIFALVGGTLLLPGFTSPDADTDVGNPFELMPLLIFAASFAAVAGTSAALTQWIGSTGIFWTSALSGVLDVDVASLSAARLASGAVSVTMAAAAVLAAISTNAAARLVIALVAGPLRYSLPLAGATVAAFLAGGAIFLLMN